MEVLLPEFPEKYSTIQEYGAVANTNVSNTKAINQAIRDISNQGGGHVLIPPGVWLTGPVELLDHVDLHLESGAVLLFDKNPEEYPLIRTNYEGEPCIRAISPIHATHAKNIAITGKGVIDGNGQLWRPVKQFKMTKLQWEQLLQQSQYVIPSSEGGIWVPTKSIYEGHAQGFVDYDDPEAVTKAAPYYDLYRPVLLSLQYCSQILIDGVTIQNSPAWNLHPFFCTNFTLRNAHIFNPYHAQNGDGIDIESCKNVHIHDTRFETGDDSICIKSGKNAIARTIEGPTEHVHIHDCVCGYGKGGFVIGSEMSRGVRHVLVENCTFLNSDVGIRLKSAMGRGGFIENIEIRDIHMINMKEQAIIISMDYVHNIMDFHETVKESTKPEDIPYFKDIRFQRVVCHGGDMGVEIRGLMNRPETIQNVLVQDSVFHTTQDFRIVDATEVRMEGTEFRL